MTTCCGETWRFRLRLPQPQKIIECPSSCVACVPAQGYHGRPQAVAECLPGMPGCAEIVVSVTERNRNDNLAQRAHSAAGLTCALPERRGQVARYRVQLAARWALRRVVLNDPHAVTCTARDDVHVHVPDALAGDLTIRQVEIHSLAPRRILPQRHGDAMRHPPHRDAVAIRQTSQPTGMPARRDEDMPGVD